ncbi:uncharacterized protein BDR25DRAFT_233822, partial [Lindgomyces ingoldianus]
PESVLHEKRIDIDLLQSAEYDFTEARLRPSDAQFRWIHIPVNDTRIVESLPNTWLHKLRPTSSIPKDIVPDHAHFMEPSFQIHTAEEENKGGNSTIQPSFTLYLPYLNWEVFRNIQGRKSDTTNKKNTSHHPRRTLDQFFYSGLRNTTYRDAGQTVSKWTGASPGVNGRTKAVEDSYVVMVDQLWIWALEDGELTATLVSCFPSHGFQFLGNSSGTKYIDVMTSVMSDSRKCQDLFDLTALLVMHSVTNVFAEENGKFADILAIYRWAISIKTARHTEKLEAFSRNQSSHNAEEIGVEGIDELNLTLEVADILDELNMLLLLMENQADVLASLQRKLYHFKPMALHTAGRGEHAIMIKDSNLGSVHVSNSGNIEGRLLLEDSKVGSLHIANTEGTLPGVRAIDGNAGILVQEAEQRLNVEKANLERLRTHAARTHEMEFQQLIELLDLEQKAASLAEARATTKQGKAIMLFTIVTIIFLPLSFFTSYFGQNVSEITGDNKNPKSSELWRIAGPISVVVILFALVVVYFIMYPRKKTREEWIEM